MRNLLLIFISACIMMLPSCDPSMAPRGDFKFLPEPELVEIFGNSDLYPDSLQFYRLADDINLPVPPAFVKDLEETRKLAVPQIIFRREKSLQMDNEGYRLDITRDQINISANKQAGLFYGYMTLQQLMIDAREQGVPLPMCYIEDTPKLAYRAIHLDMKHHMEKTEYYYELIDILAHYKINAIIAEVEDKLGYERQPKVASADALSIEEWKKLSEYADERYIEISPLVQGLGHASFILKHDEYKYLRDDPDSDWAFNPLLPETYKVQFDLYRDALEAMPHGDYLHVGGDEVHTTGRGSDMTELELQLTWLNRVCEFADELKRTPIFWDDMPIKHAGLYHPMFNPDLTRKEVHDMWKENEHKLEEYLDMFPKKCIYMRWNYSHPQAEGNIKAMEWFADNHLNVMGATAGQTRWKLMPQNESNMENIRSFANTSIEMKDNGSFDPKPDEEEIDGLLLTLWDDDSPHFELYMRGILAFAEYTWTGDERSKEEIKAAYRHREYGSALSGEEYGFVDQLEEAVGWWETSLIKARGPNFLRAMDDPLADGVIDLPFSGDQGDWTAENSLRVQGATMTIRNCNKAEAVIDTMLTLAARNQYRLEVYEQVLKLVRFSGQAIFDLQTYDIAMEGKEKQEALVRLQKLSEEFIDLRANFEKVYGQTRILTKPEGYLLDQDHHFHLANQSLNFDWQFWSEIYFLEKLEKEINNLQQ